MPKILIIADDFTGAFDTGVQFATKGAATTVVTDLSHDFQSIGKAAEVLVLVTETRHLAPQEAYEIVYRCVRKALDAGITYIYKKTDSALRGNIGSELTALMDAAAIDTLPFIPALPKLNRITKGGIHYINDVPVALSVFGQDPFEPVLDSSVADILWRQTVVPMVIHPKGAPYQIKSPGIQIFDAESDADLIYIGRQLEPEHLQFTAGCAGFATVLADLLNLTGEEAEQPKLKNALFVSCGSVNPVTIRQMKAAQEQGFPLVHLSPIQKLDRNWAESEAAGECVQQWLEQATAERRFILDVNDPDGCEDTERYAREHKLSPEQLRIRISDNLAILMKRMLDAGLEATLLCSGGDTLLALMRAVGVSELTPLCEMETGVVLTEFVYKGKSHQIMTKSGGFGERDLLINLEKKISQQSELCKLEVI